MTSVASPTLPVDEGAVRGLLAQVDRRRDDSRLLIVTAPPQWDGPEVLDTDDGPVRIVEGRSVLAVRAAMVDHPDEFLVVLTALDLRDLGEEVRARAWRQRAHRPSPWDAVKALFKVDSLDPSLRDERWMVDLLVRVAPPRGYAQPTSKFLDRDTAWKNLYRHGLSLPVDEPTTADLLDWATSPVAPTALARLGPEAVDRLAARLAEAVGPAADPLLHLVADGRGSDAVALGLVADALWPSGGEGPRVLFSERHLGRRPLSDAAAADWGRAAVAAVRRVSHDPAAVTEVITRADALLAELDPHGSGDSTVLPRTFSQRLERFGVALARVLDDGTPRWLPDAEEALDAVKAHLRAARERGRIDRADAALRLCRRAVSGPAQTSGASLAEQALSYIDEGAWVDAARHRVAEGETVPSLVAVYERLLALVDEERVARDRRFAQALAAEATVAPAVAPTLGSSRPLPIEAVLDTVVAPLARTQPVLLLVIDGLSHAAAVPLLADLQHEGWQPHGPNGTPLPPVVAALPTVTVVSRASLLAGRLVTGGQDVEREAFAAHPGLREAGAGQTPLLFHKTDLKAADGEIAPRVRDAVANAAQRVVGIVVNAVDDHLDKGGQLRLADGLEGIPVLAPLLQAAQEAQRVVVVASDHGHILGDRQRVVAARGGGERFRPAGDPPADDEIEMAGTRVLRGDNRVVVAAEDRVRYIPTAKHGYHGGATPAEALCPLVVLLPPGVSVTGWEPLPPRTPAWWDPQEAAVVVPPPPPAPEPSTTAPPPREAQLSLLEPPAEQTRPAWLEALLASPRLADQRRLAGRAALDEADLARLLQVLVAAGGTASGAALQRSLGETPIRLHNKLEAARKLLDVDGYPVLRIEADDTAVLNLDLLASQFDIPKPSQAE